MEQRPYCRTQISEVIRAMHRDSLSRNMHKQGLPEQDSNSSGMSPRRDKWHCIKLKSFYTSNEVINQIRSTEVRIFFLSKIFDR